MNRYKHRARLPAGSWVVFAGAHKDATGGTHRAMFGLVANLAGFGDTADMDGARTGMVVAYVGAALVAAIAAVFGFQTVRMAVR